MISNNRGIYDVMSQKTTTDSPESQSHKPKPAGVPASMLGCRWWPRWPMQGQHFVRSLVLLWGKLHEHSDKRKKNLLEIGMTLSSSTGRDWEASCSGLSPGHITLTLAAPWWDRCWGCHVTACPHFKPVSGFSFYFSNKLAYFTVYWSFKCFALICFNHPQMQLVLIHQN